VSNGDGTVSVGQDVGYEQGGATAHGMPLHEKRHAARRGSAVDSMGPAGRGCLGGEQCHECRKSIVHKGAG